MAVQLLTEDRRIEVLDSDLAGVTDGDPGTTYTVRQITTRMNRELSKKHTKAKFDQKTRQREDALDSEAFIDDMLDHSLVAWKGIQVDGNDVPCERDYKLMLDVTRKSALVSLAGLNQVTQDEKDSSFRSTP